MDDQFAAFRRDFFALAEKSEHIVVTSHFSPDDDSIGSVLAMYAILNTAYPHKDIRMIYTGEKVGRYGSFTNFEKIEFVPDVADELAGIDMLVILDANQYSRVSKKPELFAVVPTITIIDHHASTPDHSTISLVLPTFSSNCEIIFRIFETAEGYSKEISECLLMGILSDTGSFNHIGPAQSGVFAVAKVLVEHLGTSIDSFRSRFSGIPKKILPLLQELVKNTTYKSVPNWPDGQYSYIDRSVLQAGNYTDEDMSAASHIYMGQYLPRVEGYDWGFVITPRVDGSARMSSRSLGSSVNVRLLHEGLGIGSGHDRAAGGAFKKENIDVEPKQCIVEVLEWMEHNSPTIG